MMVVAKTREELLEMYPPRGRDYHTADREFLARVRSASLRELRVMRKQYAGIGPEWKQVAIGRGILRELRRG